MNSYGLRFLLLPFQNIEINYSNEICQIEQTTIQIQWFARIELIKIKRYQMNIVQKRVFSILNTVSYSKITTKIQNKIGFIHMNSDKDFNALSSEMRSSLSKAINQFQATNDVKVTVLLSNVKKAFCAGANIKQFQNKTSKDFQNNDIFKELHDTFYNSKKPIIAGVNGVALGGGFEMSLLCDMIFCSQQARFALPQLKLGLIPGIGGTQRLARIAGRTNAMYYTLTSQFISATRAYQMGVVGQVFKFEQLHSKVTEIAKQITNKPLPAILAAKKVIKQSQNLSMSQGVALQRNIFYPLYDTAGSRQGISAFVEKRKANMLDL